MKVVLPTIITPMSLLCSLSADTKDSEEMINPRILALIFSAYVAAKTAHTIVSNNALV